MALLIASKIEFTIITVKLMLFLAKICAEMTVIMFFFGLCDVFFKLWWIEK